MTENTATDTVWLTQEAFERLQAELEELKGPVRDNIVAKIAAAREEGDLKENGGYHAAKDEQGKLEARIRQLTALLRTAQVGEAATASGVGGPGMVLEIRFAGDTATERCLLGSREDNTHGDLEVYSAQSPLGRALTGAKVGTTVTYTTPAGKEMSVELLSAEPYTG